MANYIDYRIGARVSRQFRRVVSGKTDIALIDSGGEDRNARWKHKPYTFTASYAMVTPEAQQELTSAFYGANASLYLFRFRDAGDHVALKSPLAVVAGTSQPVQLTKRYTFGPVHSDRRIQAVSTCVVYDNTNTAVSGTLDNVLGLFSPATPWGAGPYVWSGTFDCWVRFSTDDFDMTMQTLDIATADVELVERKAIR